MPQKSQHVDSELLGRAYNSYLLALHSRALLQRRNRKIADDTDAQNDVLRKEKADASELLQKLQDRCRCVHHLTGQLKMFDICEQFCSEAGSSVCELLLSLQQLRDLLQQKVNFLQFKNMEFSEDSVEKIYFQLTKLLKILDAGCLRSSAVETTCEIHNQIARAKEDLERCARLLKTVPAVIILLYTVA
ncbi:uncharacterized protein LOC134537841 isoform X2 [Bacillus rossius redtenbacheri]